MGTRNLTAVMVDGKYPIAQYAQWDGYPTGQGVTVLAFCRDHLASEAGRAAFREKLKLCRFATKDELHERWKSVGADDSGYVKIDIAKAFQQRWPQLDRDMGADVLEFVRSATDNLLLKDAISFAGDSLFCEWAYIVDLDKGTLEVFKGFNTKGPPVGERFENAPVDERPAGQKNEYFPVRKAAEWPLDALPTKADFLAAFEGEDDDG
jgi:hypothetical protein